MIKNKVFLLFVIFSVLIAACTGLSEIFPDANGTEDLHLTNIETFDTTAGVKAAQWSENVTITLGNDTFRYVSNGFPNHELPEKFLIPINVGSQPFNDNTLDDFNVVITAEYLTKSPLDVTLTLHPSYADEVEETSLGQIGFIVSGARLFNDYENMERTVVALDDNISFNFDDTGHDHAAFVDDCNGHPLQDGSNYHYHGIPKCVVATIDVDGEHSHVIGFLRDGFPVYGNKGENGIPVTNADLDECSGHFGVTPEFPEGIYHYHLTNDEAPYSIDCYKGIIESSTGDSGARDQQMPDLAAAATKLGVTEDALKVALGDPSQGPPDFAAAAQILGVTEAELIDALGIPEGGLPPQGPPPTNKP